MLEEATVPLLSNGGAHAKAGSFQKKRTFSDFLRTEPRFNEANSRQFKALLGAAVKPILISLQKSVAETTKRGTSCAARHDAKTFGPGLPSQR